MFWEEQIRLSAFKWLEEQTLFDDVLPRRVLERGFRFRGERVTLMGPQGIWKPKVFESVPLSITTTPHSPYKDRFRDGFLHYAYQGTDPLSADNKGLSEARRKSIPLIYFHGIVPGRYLAAWPVFIVAEDPGALFFTVAIDDKRYLAQRGEFYPTSEANSRRRYITAAFKTRLHQNAFRLRVLAAYRQQCAFCRLKHEELLDAAYIIADRDPQGEPLVSNALALCKIHHAAFDRNFIGVTPDYDIVVREDLLREIDGPMLRHGIQGIHRSKLILPRNTQLQPDRERLAKRFADFCRASSC